MTADRDRLFSQTVTAYWHDRDRLFALLDRDRDRRLGSTTRKVGRLLKLAGSTDALEARRLGRVPAGPTGPCRALAGLDADGVPY